MGDNYTQDFIDEVKGALNSGSSGGGTIDQTARDDISKHASDSEIHVTTVEKASWNGKAELTDIPTTLPASGGNADTVNNHTVETDVPVNAIFTDTKNSDVIADAAGIVTLNGLQGGVPFSGITLSGDIVGQDVTLTACGKNLADFSDVDGKLISGISFAYDNGNVVLNGTATAQIYVGIKIHLSAGAYTVSGGTDKNARVVLRNKSWLNIADAIAGATVTVVSDDYYVHIAIAAGTVCDNAVIKPQLERGAVVTEYEPYSGSVTAITPDSNPYTVPNDIRQQEGVNNVSVSAGEVSVTGVKRNAAVKKIWDNKADLSDIPTTLPANGGNADTLGGNHTSDFYQYANGLRKPLTHDAAIDIFSNITPNHAAWNSFADVETDASQATLENAPETTSPSRYHIWTYGESMKRGHQIAVSLFSRKVYIRYLKDSAWSDWKNIADGGNADTVDGLHSSSFFINNKPHVTSVTSTESSIHLKWLPVDGATKYAVSKYNADTSYDTYSSDITDTEYTITGLTAGTEYSILVQAYINGAWTTFSTADHIIVRTNIQTDVVSDTAGIATLDGLQGGVPFSEITLSGDIIGQEITLRAGGENLLTFNSHNETETISGITFTRLPDGTITANGTATAVAQYLSDTIEMVDGNTYTLTGCPAGGSGEGYSITNQATANITDMGSGKTFTYDAATFGAARFKTRIAAGYTCNNVVFRPVLCSGAAVITKITPDSTPFVVTDDIRQRDGANTVSVSKGNVTTTGVRRNAAIKRAWDKLDELATAIIVSNGETTE